jgi:uncharacterized caspase-like protein
LIIGNAAYRHVGRLVNPGRDARLLASTLERFGVECTCLTDCSNARMSQAVDAFVVGLRRRPADLAWFYFSGHGAYVDGHNVMLGVDTVVSSPAALLSQGFDLDALQSMLEQVRPRAAVLVEDACRNNPFVQDGVASTRAIHASPGLVPRAWGGTLTAYSTAPYTEAMDWPHRPNGPYASALSTALREPRRQSLEDVFRATADAVWRSTAQRQQPGYYSDLREEVWVQDERLALAAVRAPALAGGTAAGVGARSPRLRQYQANVHVAAALGSPADWDAEVQALTDRAGALVDHDAAARQAIAQARRRGAALDVRTLGAMLLEAQPPARRILDQAQSLFMLAAQQGYVPAQIFLGELAHRRGDDALAYTWLHLASQAGSARASQDLMNMLLDRAADLGPPQSLQQLRQRMQDFPQAQAQLMNDLSAYLKNLHGR